MTREPQGKQLGPETCVRNAPVERKKERKKEGKKETSACMMQSIPRMTYDRTYVLGVGATTCSRIAKTIHPSDATPPLSALRSPLQTVGQEQRSFMLF